MDTSLEELARTVANCRRCARLRIYGAEMARRRRRAFADECYWARPVPAFGDPQARLLIVGLAPAAHGAHRTGRMFTGDRSGDFLFAALHRCGFASQPHAQAREDGMRLRDCYITAAAHCAPPGNKPLPAELANCRPYLERELDLLRRLRVILSLGRLAHEQLLRVLQKRGLIETFASVPFAHGAAAQTGPWLLLSSYHPSQQNTFTGRLTPAMLDGVLRRAATAL